MEARSIASLTLSALLLVGTAGAPTPATAQSGSVQPAGGSRALDQIETMIDAGRAREALDLLDRFETPDRSVAARALLLRSTALFMLGQIERGRLDLEEALAKDPELRQAWLNRAALDISDGRLDRALEAFHRARDLDPDAPDAELNIGAVLLMQGKTAEAQPYLGRYLAAAGDSAEAWYLVASNYALANRGQQAVEHLSRAIAIDERIRLRARTDANFSRLAEEAGFQHLLTVESHRIPAGSHATFRTFESLYLAGEGKLLPAVLDALQLTGEPFDRQIEVTADWALIWGEMRIKIRNDAREGGRVELTAPRERFSDSEWRARAAKLLTEIALQLAKR